MLYNHKNSESGNMLVGLAIGLGIVLGGIWLFTGINPLQVLLSLIDLVSYAVSVY